MLFHTVRTSNERKVNKILLSLSLSMKNSKHFIRMRRSEPQKQERGELSCMGFIDMCGPKGYTDGVQIFSFWS